MVSVERNVLIEMPDGVSWRPTSIIQTARARSLPSCSAPVTTRTFSPSTSGSTPTSTLATASCIRTVEEAGHLGAKVTISPNRRTDGQLATGLPINRGSTAGWLPSGRATWGSRNGRLRPPGPRTSSDGRRPHQLSSSLVVSRRIVSAGHLPAVEYDESLRVHGGGEA